MKAIIKKASLVEDYCNVDIFEEANNLNVDIFEDCGYFNDGNEEDCNRIDDLGVEAVKVYPV